MVVGSSSVPKKKRGAQGTTSPVPNKQKTRTSARAQEEVVAQSGPSTLGAMESSARIGVSIADIPGYVPPTRPVANPRKMTKNQKYPMKMPTIPQGMACTMDIVPALMGMKYDDHDMLAYTEITKGPYVPMVAIGGDSILRIP